MQIDKLKATGQVSLVLTDKNGNIKSQVEYKNLVVTSGLAFITSRITGTASDVMSHMAIGTGTVAAATGDTALGTQVAIVALTSQTVTTKTTTNDSVTYVGTFGPGVGTGAITEAGIFNAASAGTMLARTVFGVNTKAADDTLTVTWKVTMAGV